MSLLASSAHFLTSSRLVRYFRLTAPAAVLGHLGTISLKNLTKGKEVGKLEKELIMPYNIPFNFPTPTKFIYLIFSSSMNCMFNRSLCDYKNR